MCFSIFYFIFYYIFFIFYFLHFTPGEATDTHFTHLKNTLPVPLFSSCLRMLCLRIKRESIARGIGEGGTIDLWYLFCFRKWSVLFESCKSDWGISPCLNRYCSFYPAVDNKFKRRSSESDFILRPMNIQLTSHVLFLNNLEQIISSH